MRLLIRNASVWKWDAPVGGELRWRYGFSLLYHSWLAVDAEGRLHLPISDEPTPDEGNFEAVLDAKGLVVLPGLMDAHIHVSGTGESLNFLDLKTCESIGQFQAMLKEHIAQHSHLKWVIGVNWDQVTGIWAFP
jgi:predicted amidohydrolase YtcJ